MSSSFRNPFGLPLPPLRSIATERAALQPPPQTSAPPPLVRAPVVHLKADGPSVFEVLNIFRRNWFLNRDHLIAKVLSAQKDDRSNYTWVEFDPLFHTSLIRRALALLPPLCPVARGKRVMFVFLLEVLSGKEGAGRSGPLFFALPEKKRRVRKRPSSAATTSAPRPPPGPPVSSVGVRSSITPTPPIFPPARLDSFPPDPVTLSQVEDLLATSEMIQALHRRTPPPALSPSSTAMELDAGPIPSHPPASSAGSDFSSESFHQDLFREYPWTLSHHPPASGSWQVWLTQALEHGIPAPILVQVIDNYTSPRTKSDRAVAKTRKALLKSIVHDLGSLFSPSPSATPPP